MEEKCSDCFSDDKEKKYPDCFPDDIEERIIKDGAKAFAILGYRVCFSKEINRDAFICSKERRIRKSGDAQHNRDVEQQEGNELDLCSTSLFDEVASAHNFVKSVRYPKAKIAIGTTDPSCGLSMLTKNSLSGRGKDREHHIDWWIFAKATPEVFFKFYEE